MRCTKLASGFVLLSLGILWQPAASNAANLPVGTWKLTLYQPNTEIDLCLIKVVAEENQQLRATVVARASSEINLKVEKISVQARQMSIALSLQDETYTVIVMLPEDIPATKLYGSFGRRSDFLIPVTLEQTKDQELDAKKSFRQTPVNQVFIEVLLTANPERQQELLRTLLKQHSDHPLAILASIELIDRLADLDGRSKEIQEIASTSLRLASRHGPAMDGYASHRIGLVLLNSSKSQALAFPYLEKAAATLVDAPASFRARLYKSLANAYRHSGQAAKAQELVAKIEALERQADDEYRRNVPPFQVTPAQLRKEAGRALVLELFTGTQCPPCVAADVAFEAVARTYPAHEVILLQYHLHIPRADPLTNPDTIKRGEFYRVRGTPTAFLNGKEVPPLGGSMSLAETRYKTLLKLLDATREEKAPCQIELQVTKQDRNVDVQATVSGYEKMSETTRLLFVLVEEEVRYPAPNGIRFHHHVVRALAGGHDGFPLEKDKTRQTLRINLNDLEKNLHDYLNRYSREESFPDDERPLELKKLKIVALIQDMKSREILHAAIASVPE